MRNGLRRGAGIVAGIAAALALGGPTLASSGITRGFALDVRGKVSKPKPKPAALEVEAGWSGPGPSDFELIPPKLLEATLKLDRHLRFDTEGLATCDPKTVRNAAAGAARDRCRKAIVGSGSATATVARPEQEPVDTAAVLTAFNGKRRAGKPVLLVHAFTSAPERETFVVKPKIVDADGGFGSRLNLVFPPIAHGDANLTGFDLKLAKTTWRDEGRRHAYVSGKCTGGAFEVEGKFAFLGDTREVVTATDPC